MSLTNTQIEILQRINKNLRRGDIKEICATTGLSRVSVANTLNPFRNEYNEAIVTAANNLVAERDKARKKMLERLPS